MPGQGGKPGVIVKSWEFYFQYPHISFLYHIPPEVMVVLVSSSIYNINQVVEHYCGCNKV